MKNLKESLLGDLEDNLASGDNIIKNPFKYLANLSKTEINSREKYKKELEYFETSIESQCKVKEWQKGLGIGIKFVKERENGDFPEITHLSEIINMFN